MKMNKRRFSLYIGCAVALCFCISCKNGPEHNNEKSVDFDLDSISLSWEQMTIALIEKVHPSDSSIEYFVGPDRPLYKEGEYIRKEIISNRENLMRAVLPVLLGMTDSILVDETYGVEYLEIDVYGHGKEYMYQIDPRTHLPYECKIKPVDLSEGMRWVLNGFYHCYQQGYIYDISCITLITRTNGRPKLEILALVVNGVSH